MEMRTVEQFSSIREHHGEWNSQAEAAGAGRSAAWVARVGTGGGAVQGGAAEAKGFQLVLAPDFPALTGETRADSDRMASAANWADRMARGLTGDVGPLSDQGMNPSFVL
jgi:hypothetical protein